MQYFERWVSQGGVVGQTHSHTNGYTADALGLQGNQQSADGAARKEDGNGRPEERAPVPFDEA